MGANDSVNTSNRGCPTKCVLENANHIGVIIGGEGFMTRLEVEHFTQTSLVATARAEHFTAFKVADEHQFIRFRDEERLSIGFLML